jgi:hypothetical protein
MKEMMMNDTPFDPDSFLDATLPGANSTKRDVVPAGTYVARLSNLEVKNGTVNKPGENFGKPWVALNFRWNIDLAGTNQVVFDSVFLELGDDGRPDMGKGKNVKLGKLREAIGLNSGPVQFRAFDGRVATIKVDHRMYEGDVQAEVKGYAKA